MKKYLVGIRHETQGYRYFTVNAVDPKKALIKAPKQLNRTRMLDMDSIRVKCEL